MSAIDNPYFIIDPTVVEQAHAHAGLDAKKIQALLKKDLPADTCIRLTSVGIPHVFFVQITYKDPENTDRFFSFTRSVNLANHHAYHAKARVSDTMHKAGIARIVNQNMVALYQHLDVKTVSTNATEIGVYAWARMGFIPYEAEWQTMRAVISRRLDYLEAYPPQEGPLPWSVTQNLRSALASDDPKSFWRIVDNDTRCDGEALGKVLTLEDEVLCNRMYGPAFETLKWAGALHIHDSDCMQRLATATGIKPPPYVRPAIRLR